MPAVETGVMWAVLIAFSTLVGSVARSHSMHITVRLLLRVRSGLTGVIFQKALRLDSKGREAMPMGAIVNLMSSDTQRIVDAHFGIHAAWSGPIVVLVGVWLLYLEVGLAALSALGTMLLILPLTTQLAKWQSQLEEKLAAHTDQRIGLITNLLLGIRVVKYYAWERPFLAQVTEQRKQELLVLRNALVLRGLNFGLLMITPLAVCVATFATYALLLGGVMEPAVVFTALSLIYTIRFPFLSLPQGINDVIGIRLSLRRIATLLSLSELPSDVVQRLDQPGIELTDAALSYDELPLLQGLNFKVEPGQLVSILGPVGSGKSTLLQGLLGEVGVVGGTVALGGRLAYVPQNAFIINATLRDNVLFGRPFDARRYRKVVRACSLEADIAQLPGGDMTEIGERGINIRFELITPMTL
jgi:ABC-type multidrug transport system fused ATPase/permease subunit